MESLSGIIAVIFGAAIYSFLGKKGAFYTSFVFIFLGGFLIFAIESRTLLVPHSLLNNFEGSYE